MLSALVATGIEGGYLTNARLAIVHWQAGNRPVPAPRVTVSGESALWVDPAEIPSDSDIGKLGRALAEGRHGERDKLMANTAAYSGLRWGELTALTISQVDQARARHHRGPPGDRSRRATVRRGAQVPEVPQDGLPPPHARRLTARRKARGPHRTGHCRARSRHQPARADLSLPAGKHWRSSNFNRNVVKRAYLAIGWRDADGNGPWNCGDATREPQSSRSDPQSRQALSPRRPLQLRRSKRYGSRRRWTAPGHLTPSDRSDVSRDELLPTPRRETRLQQTLGLTAALVYDSVPDQVGRICENARMVQGQIDRLSSAAVPAEDDANILDLAWLRFHRRDLMPVVQPPKPDIVPADAILRRARARQASISVEHS